MKRIAVVTGASSGMGRLFAETVDRVGKFDEVWVIARRLERLEALELPFPKRCIPLDLGKRESFDTYKELLAAEEVEVGLLVNASGFGRFGAACDTALEVNLNMVDLNCQALMALCQLTVPYMKSGAKILNIASVAAFQPIPYIGVYAASKSFVLSYSRALNRELKGRGIGVMALCPFWTKTEFFDRATADGKEGVVKKYTAMYDPEEIVGRAWRDLARGRDKCQYGFVARAQAVLCKLMPHSFIMSYWMHQQGLD